MVTSQMLHRLPCHRTSQSAHLPPIYVEGGRMFHSDVCRQAQSIKSVNRRRNRPTNADERDSRHVERY